MAQNDLSERIEALETRLAFQDDTIDSLNQTVTQLNDDVQILKAQLQYLAEKNRSDGSPSSNPNEVEIPPHY
ncbi:MAG: SlyX family protein [Gammaproteobacteria bacterium]|nr:SlyX family protein [Gammaproteobacteria bacterium]NNJ72689.1 SlyX family protein [Enterobacterales bacterium]